MKSQRLVKILTVTVFATLMASYVAYRSGAFDTEETELVNTHAAEGGGNFTLANTTLAVDTPPPGDKPYMSSSKSAIISEPLMPSSKLAPVTDPIFIFDTKKDTPPPTPEMMGSSKVRAVFSREDAKIFDSIMKKEPPQMMGGSKSDKIFTPDTKKVNKKPEMMRGSKSAPVFTPNQSNGSNNNTNKPE